MTTTPRNRPPVAAMRAAIKSIDRWIELHKKYDEQFPNGWATHMMTESDDREYSGGYEALEYLRSNHLDYLRALLDYIAYLEGLCGRAAVCLDRNTYHILDDNQVLSELKATASSDPAASAAAGEE